MKERKYINTHTKKQEGGTSILLNEHIFKNHLHFILFYKNYVNLKYHDNHFHSNDSQSIKVLQSYLYHGNMCRRV